MSRSYGKKRLKNHEHSMVSDDNVEDCNYYRLSERFYDADYSSKKLHRFSAFHKKNVIFYTPLDIVYILLNVLTNWNNISTFARKQNVV